MGNLVFQATLGGQVNLVGPNTASTFNLNVPAVSSTIASLAAQTFAGAQTFTVDATISGLTVGKGGGAVSGSTALGTSALAVNTTGINTASGYQSLYSVTTGTGSTAFGNSALKFNTANYNNAFGENALVFNTTGTQNSAFGTSALQTNTTGANNTAVGYQAGYSNTTGVRNTALGQIALYSNSTGQDNAAIAQGALYNNTTGNYNTAVGKDALVYNTTASNNTAVGYQAGYSNTTGLFTAIGYQAGYSNTTGNYNTFVGNLAGNANTTSSENTAVGYQAGRVSTGADNTYLGTYAGYSATTGTYNCYVGAGAGFSMTTGAKNTILGAYNGNQGGLDIRTSSNRIVLSDGDGNPCIYNDKTTTTLNNPSGRYTILDFNNACVNKAELYWDNTALQLYAVAGSNGVYLNNNANSWTSVSDERKKDIIEPITNAVNKVSTLRAVIGKYKTDEEGTRRSFLIAQDVQAVLPEAVSETESKEGLVLGMSYTDVMPLLVAAIKELKTIVDAQAAEIVELKAKVGI